MKKLTLKLIDGEVFEFAGKHVSWKFDDNTQTLDVLLFPRDVNLRAKETYNAFVRGDLKPRETYVFPYYCIVFAHVKGLEEEEPDFEEGKKEVMPNEVA